MSNTSITYMAKKFIAPLMNEYTFQGVVNEVSDSRYGDEYIDDEELNISEMYDFLQDHENAHFIYNFIEDNKDEIVENIYHDSFKSKYMENIREFWLKNLIGLMNLTFGVFITWKFHMMNTLKVLLFTVSIACVNIINIVMEIYQGLSTLIQPFQKTFIEFGMLRNLPR